MLSIIIVDCDEFSTDEIVTFTTDYVRSSPRAQHILFTIGESFQYDEIINAYNEIGTIHAWRIDRSRVINGGILTLVSLLMNCHGYKFDIHSLSDSKTTSALDYLKTNCGIQGAVYYLGQCEKKSLEAVSISIADSFLNNAAKMMDIIEDSEIKHHFQIQRTSYCELVECEKAFFLKKYDEDMRSVFARKPLMWYLDFPFYELKEAYNQLLKVYIYDEATAEKIMARQHFLDIYNKSKGTFKADVKNYNFPVLLLWLSVYMFMHGIQYERENAYGIATLSIFRALEIYCIAIVVSNRAGVFNHQYELTIDGEPFPSFGKIWKHVLKYSGNVSEDTKDQIKRVVYIRNLLLMTHGTLPGAKVTFDYFYNAIKQFILKYEETCLPTHLRIWKNMILEYNINPLSKLPLNVIKSTFNDLNYNIDLIEKSIPID